MNASTSVRLHRRASTVTALSSQPKLGPRIAAVLSAALLLLGAGDAVAQITFLDFSGGTSGWTTAGTVNTLSVTDSFTIGGSHYSLAPAAGESMVKLRPTGSAINGAAAADTAMGLSAGTIAGLLNNANGAVTNFGLLAKDFTFTAGTYKFAWAYAASDYQPFNDGVMFAVSGGGTQIVSSLARNGSNASDTSGPGAGTLILGSYGSTAWMTSTFTIAAGGTYKVSFASYNWKDTGLDPVYYVAGTAGTFTGTPVQSSGGEPQPPPPPVATDIDTGASSYASTALGTTLNPTFAGGTLIADVPSISVNFTVNTSGGTIQPSGGATTTFSGVIADAGDSSGSITIAGGGAGGAIVFTGANTYTGPTTIAAGATLQLSGGGALASPIVGIAAGGTLADNNGGLAPTALVVNSGQFILGADQTLGGIMGNGSLNLGANILAVGAGETGGVIAGPGSLQKIGPGTLVLTGANTFTGPTTIVQGQLALGGSLAGDVSVGSAGLLSGSGVIHGSAFNQGITSPGNSPGLLTIDGSYTESGTLRIEIDGAAGAGVNPGGHDQLVVGGAVSLQPGSVLQLTRSVANGFEPGWGQNFQIVAAAGGINGAFSVLDRSTFSTQLLFDYGTGRVYGTGLAQGAAFGQVAGPSANRRALLAAVTGDTLIADSSGQSSFFDSRRPAGSLLQTLLASNAPLALLDTLSPVAHAGLADYALQVTRSLGREARNLPVVAGDRGWALAAGYTGYRNGIGAAADDTNTDLRSNAAVVDVTRKLGDRFAFGGSVALDDGSIRARRYASDVTGKAIGVHLNWQPSAGRRIVIEAGASYASYDYDTVRATPGAPATSKTSAEAYDAWSRAKVGLYENEQVGLSAFTGLAYTYAKVSAFGEKSGTGALNLRKIEDELLVGEIGAELAVQVAGKLRVVGEAAYERNFQAPRREVFATFAGERAAFRVTARGFDRDAIRGGARVEYALGERTTLSAHYSAAVSDRSEVAQTFGARLQFRF